MHLPVLDRDCEMPFEFALFVFVACNRDRFVEARANALAVGVELRERRPIGGLIIRQRALHGIDAECE